MRSGFRLGRDWIGSQLFTGIAPPPALWEMFPLVYPLVISGTAVISIIYALESAGISLGILSRLCAMLPMHSQGFGWLTIAAIMMAISLLKKKKT